MGRIAKGGFGALLVAMAFGVSGCGGDGLEQGLPQDTAPAVIPSNVQTKMMPVRNKGSKSGSKGHASISTGTVGRTA